MWRAARTKRAETNKAITTPSDPASAQEIKEEIVKPSTSDRK